MKETRFMMGMPITVEVVDDAREKKSGKAAAKKANADIQKAITDVFAYFDFVDKKFSTYKDTSEITAFNKGLIAEGDFSPEMKEIFKLAEQTKRETKGFFNIIQPPGKNKTSIHAQPAGFYDPSGIVKGWAIWNAAKMLTAKKFKNFYVEAGGDIQVSGINAAGKPWSVGIQNPFAKNQIIKKVWLAKNEGMATSGTYVRGQHIYNPFKAGPISDIVSLTVIGPNIYEADRFATAAFAMSQSDDGDEGQTPSIEGINFIENIDGFEGYVIDKNGMATMTNGFEKYTVEPS
jgi:thiamine biosynthesis lipoprotein